MTVPDVGYRVPEFQEHYHIFSVDDLTIYVDKNIEVESNQLEFIATKILFMTNLDVIGVKNLVR